MTHVQSRNQNPAPNVAPRPDPEEVAGFRWLADDIGLTALCDLPECRRGKRCRGSLKVPEHWSSHPFPPCLAQVVDDLYEPVLRWREIMKNLNAIAAAARARAAERPKA